MIKNFLLNILLSFVWVALTGHLNYTNFAFGLILGFFILCSEGFKTDWLGGSGA